MRCKTHALLEINHAFSQHQYVDWKYAYLAPLVSTAPRMRFTNGNRRAYRFVTRSLPVLTPYYHAFYGHDRRKSIPGVRLTDLALAVWFMDDGSRSRSSVYLNTQQFDAASQARLIELLNRDFGIRAALNRDKQYYRIRISTGSMQLFRAAVSRHLLPEMRYKLPAV